MCNINTKVKNLIRKWKAYYLTIHGRLTIVKSILIAQYIYIGSVMDILNEKEMENIQNMLNHFVEHNELNISPKKRWIPNDLLYAPRNEGGFNMINVKDFFCALRNNWIRRYIQGLDDHWADLLDINLQCDQASRSNLLKMGAENPKLNTIIDKELPSLSNFLKAYKELNKIFTGNKEIEDNRWLNSSIFYNPTITKRKGPTKKNQILMEYLKPCHFGLKEEFSWRIDLISVYQNGSLISLTDFNTRYVSKMNSLEYLSLKRILNDNLGKMDGSKIDTRGKLMESHWKTNLVDLFQKTNKGSKAFRKVLNSHSKIKVDHN